MLGTERRRAILGVGTGLYLLGLGFLGGIAIERVRFDRQRAAVLKHYDEAVRQWHAYLMQAEQTPPGREANEDPWTPYLRKVDAALTQKEVGAAERAWHEAYLEALRSPRWEGMIEVGDAYLRIGEVARGRQVAAPQARARYLAALFRARRQDSLDGVLRTAEAFAALGDRALVEQCLRIAEDLAARAPDPQARDRVRALQNRLVSGSFVAGGR